MKLGPLLFGATVAVLIADPLHAQGLAQPAASHDCGFAQSCTAQLSANVAADNSLIAVIRIGGVGSVAGTNIIDSLGSTWILDATEYQSSDRHVLAVYRAASARAGSAAVTVSNNSAYTMRIVSLAEIAGLASGSPDASTLAAGTGTSAQPGALAALQPGDYVLLTARFHWQEPIILRGRTVLYRI